MRDTKYVIEARHPSGSLDLTPPGPETVFGDAAITGITSDQMAKVIFRHKPDATLRGGSIPQWPGLLDPRWVAREKTW